MDSGFFVAVLIITAVVAVVISVLSSSIKRDEAIVKEESKKQALSEEGLAIISQYTDITEAKAAQMELESEGIESFLDDEYGNLMIPSGFASGNIKLQVRKSDYESAKQVLAREQAIISKKTECTYKLEEKDGKYEPVLVYKQVFVFDSAGNIFEDIKYDPEDKTPAKRFYRYDEQGRLSDEESIYQGVGLFHKVSYKYDEQGRLVEEITSSPESKLTQSTKYEYDEAGRVLNEESYQAGAVPSLVEKFYDEAGKLVQENFYEGSAVNGKCCYRYNDAGKIIEEKSYDDINGPVSEKISHFYNDKGLLKESHTSNSNGEVYLKTLYRYDEKGYLIDITDFELDENHKEIPLKMVAMEYEFNNNVPVV